MTPVAVSRRTMRQYVLGAQGLWPGRRWSGPDGARAALREMQALQVDPLNVVARSHELALHSRVSRYTLGDLDTLLYERREFFDYGGTVLIVPMEELPYWRVAMRRRLSDPRWAGFAREHGAALALVRDRLRACGPLRSRDFAGPATGSTFRSGKEAARALYYLWLTGELMTHGRRGFDRVYQFLEQVAPPEHRHEAAPADADAFFARKALDLLALPTARQWAAAFGGFSRRRLGRSTIGELTEDRRAVPVAVEGGSEIRYCAADRLALLAEVEDGRVPDPWRPVRVRSTEEVTLLAPLDVVSARGRAADLFGFDYVWEVYKPAHRRRFGYYTMPILRDDRLVGRIDPKLHRETGTLVINGLWLEDPGSAGDARFVSALAAGLAALGGLVGAERIDLGPVGGSALASALERGLPATAGRSGA